MYKLKSQKKKMARVSFWEDEELLKKIDALCKKYKVDRSEFIRHANFMAVEKYK